MSVRIFRRPFKVPEDRSGPWLISVQLSFQREERAIHVRDALNILKAEAAVSQPSQSMSEIIGGLLISGAVRVLDQGAVVPADPLAGRRE